jgi:hypothetical protein
MAARSSTGQNWDHVISSLKEIRGDIEMLRGMFSHIKKWAHVADAAETKINATLYELTGSDFYKPKEGRNPL